MRTQTWQAFRNVETAMRAAGGSLTVVVSLRFYIAVEQQGEGRQIIGDAVNPNPLGS